MLPVRRCLHTIDQAVAAADSTLSERIHDALTELEAAYARPSERVVALEAVLHAVERGPSASNVPLIRLLRIAVDRRQSVLARPTDTRPDPASRASAAEAPPPQA